MKIGFLPLYVKMYDDTSPTRRDRLQVFYDKLVGIIEAKGLEVVTAPICRLDAEFKDAVAKFEAADVDALVTIHLAYSPSLESIDALSATKLPLIVLDTTETLEFTNMQNGDEINYNHGIHGVMDMCAMLTRRGKKFEVVAGHYAESDVVDRMVGRVKAAVAAKALRSAKVALLGEHFAGMGDFLSPYEEMAYKLGIKVEDLDPAEVREYFASVTDAEIDAEIADNAARFDISDNIVEDSYRATVKSCLAIRKIINDKKYTAFTAAFNTITMEKAGVEAMPFIEACKSMERGLGYAGEGDTLTAAFVGAFMQAYPTTNFVEIFCPDWKNNVLFMSHMGELNYRIADTKPFLYKAGNTYGADNFPYVTVARYKGGKGVYVNVAHDEDNFKLIISATEMLQYNEDNFRYDMRGWMKVGCDLGEFLAKYSNNGGTHHSIFVYDASVEEIAYFGKLLGLEVVII